MDTRTLRLIPIVLALAACGDSDTKKPDADATTSTATDTVDDGTDATATETAEEVTPDVEETTEPTLTVRYHRVDGAYGDWVLDLTGDIASAGVAHARVDDFGAIFEVPIPSGATSFSYQFRRSGDGALDPADPLTAALADAPDGVWHWAGGEFSLLRAPPAIPGPDQLVVHYLRKDGEYSGWGLHTWQDVVAETAWTTPLMPGGTDPDLGAWYVVNLKPDAAQIGVIVHSGDTKDPGPDMFISPATNGDMVFILSGTTEIYSWPMRIPEFSIRGAAAHWLDEDTIAWSPAAGAATYELRWALDASVEVVGPDVVGGTVIALTPDGAGLAADLKAAYPHLAARGAFTIGAGDLDDVREALQGELVVVARDGTGKALEATRVQTAGVLDRLYTYAGPLGATFDGDGIHFALWAPTAQSVSLLHYPADRQTHDTLAMVRGDDGVWRLDQPLSWAGSFYRYQITVFHPITNKIETTTVTDPYAVSLATNGAFVHLVDLDAAETKPAGWDALVKPGIAAPEDISIYEAHIRDFSATDATVPAADRGTYRAFTHNGVGGADLSDGMAHLSGLADAGLTHLHLLPSFDFATVEEDRTKRVDLGDTFARLCTLNTSIPEETCTANAGKTVLEALQAADPATGEAQEIASWMRGLDGFNWGYDPVHYNVPEGSYASNPDGATRIREYREMVKALWDVGLRVVSDVVYNHTSQSGLGDKVVLDKIVPGYYHRLNPDTGLVETSTCCANTATENAMMRRLMVDSVVLWARAYKIDAFRFDLMGHHMKADMLAVRAALDALTEADDGVDGPAVYVYGEGWNFGEVANGARGVNATQGNMAGTGIGTFNDRLRDSVRGGSAFDSGAALRSSQGFVSGLYYEPNEASTADATTKEALLLAVDRITVGMAGGLRAFRLTDRNGNVRTGALIPYNGAMTGYTLDPQETITYVDKHDNQTLFDITAYHAKTGTTMADRVRMQALGMATVVLGQGVPFLHMGIDLLRSKSMERDSYDSGDWFNRVDFSYTTNNWNVGLPNAGKDQANWPIISAILEDEAIAPTAADIEAAAAHLRELLTIRTSTPLFRLRTEADVKLRLLQRNVGPSQNPGVLFFTVSDATCTTEDLDPALDGVAIFINARPESASFTLDGATGWALHPAHVASTDAVVKTATFGGGTFTVPARTAAVFVRAQGGTRGAEPSCNTL